MAEWLKATVPKTVVPKGTVSPNLTLSSMNKFELNRHSKMTTQLGMPFGTASGRLRKLVMFDVLKRHGENFCYRCTKEIETPAELSIEHKEPWENIDAALFWDLANIAFSHFRCNVKAGRKVNTRPHHRRVAPVGLAWCVTHRLFLPIADFSKKQDRWNGVRHDCKECEKKYKDKVRHGDKTCAA